MSIVGTRNREMYTLKLLFAITVVCIMVVSCETIPAVGSKEAADTTLYEKERLGPVIEELMIEEDEDEGLLSCGRPLPRCVRVWCGNGGCRNQIRVVNRCTYDVKLKVVANGPFWCSKDLISTYRSGYESTVTTRSGCSLGAVTLC